MTRTACALIGRACCCGRPLTKGFTRHWLRLVCMVIGGSPGLRRRVLRLLSCLVAGSRAQHGSVLLGAPSLSVAIIAVCLDSNKPPFKRVQAPEGLRHVATSVSVRLPRVPACHTAAQENPRNVVGGSAAQASGTHPKVACRQRQPGVRRAALPQFQRRLSGAGTEMATAPASDCPLRLRNLPPSRDRPAPGGRHSDLPSASSIGRRPATLSRRSTLMLLASIRWRSAGLQDEFQASCAARRPL